MKNDDIKSAKTGFRFNDPCLIGVDYMEFEPDTYKAVVIEMPNGAEHRFGSEGFEKDLAYAVFWFAVKQPTQVLHFRSSVLHHFRDRREVAA